MGIKYRRTDLYDTVSSIHRPAEHIENDGNEFKNDIVIEHSLRAIEN